MWYRRLSLLALLLAPLGCWAQGNYTTVISSPEPLPNCTPASQGQQQPIIWDVTTQQLKYCVSTNIWATMSLPAFPVTPVGVGQVLLYVPTAIGDNWVLPGIAGRSIAGSGGTDTILTTDTNNRPQYVVTANTAVSLPTPGTLGVPFGSIKFVNDSASNSITVTPAGGWTISVGNGALGASTTVTANSWIVCNVDPRNNSNWSCDAPGGGGTVSSSTTGYIPQYTAATTVGTSSPLLDNGVTTANTLTYAGTGGITATGPLAAKSDGTHNAKIEMSGNTTDASVTANTVGWGGPNTATTGTAYRCDLPWTNPSGGQVLSCGTPSGGVSTGTWVAPGGSFPLLGPSDSAGAPNYSWSANSDRGMFNDTSNGFVSTSYAGTEVFGVFTHGTMIKSSSCYGWVNPAFSGAFNVALCDSTGTESLLEVSTSVSSPNSSGFLKTAQSIAVTSADVTCGTGGTISSCTTFQTITGLSLALPHVATNWSFTCDLVVGQATAAAANQIGVQTATNGATNLTASAIVYTAAAVSTAAAITDVASTTTAQSVVTFTPGGVGTKMPVHLAGTIEGVSASGTTLNITVLTGAAADLLTVYRGSSCWVY